jgi:hypothetical protein
VLSSRHCQAQRLLLIITCPSTPWLVNHSMNSPRSTVQKDNWAYQTRLAKPSSVRMSDIGSFAGVRDESYGHCTSIFQRNSKLI